MLMEQKQLTVVKRLDDALVRPRESVVMLFGDQREISRSEWLRLRRFVAQGGSLLVASEQSFDLPGICSFIAGPISSDDADAQYQSYPDCLVLDDIASEHSAAAGVNRIVVNRCGLLTPPVDESLEWTVLASLPESTTPESAGGHAVLLAGLDREPTGGVMVLSADQSLFSNGMLWHGDNAILVIRLADTLTRGTRRRLFVMSNNTVLSGYRQSQAMQPQAQRPQPPPIPPVPPIDRLPPPKTDLATLLRAANLAVDKVQESNLLNETLRDQPRNMRPVAWLRTVLLILLLTGTACILWQLIKRRSQMPPLRTARFMQSMFGAASARQIDRGEFGAATELLARNLCASLTNSQNETDWLRLSQDGHPVATLLSRRERVRFRELVRIAVSGCRVRMSRRQFEAIGRLIEQLERLTANATPKNSAGRGAIAGVIG